VAHHASVTFREHRSRRTRAGGRARRAIVASSSDRDRSRVESSAVASSSRRSRGRARRRVWQRHGCRSRVRSKRLRCRLRMGRIEPRRAADGSLERSGSAKRRRCFLLSSPRPENRATTREFSPFSPQQHILFLPVRSTCTLVLPGMDAQRMVSTAEPDRVRWPARDSLGVVGKVADVPARPHEAQHLCQSVPLDRSRSAQPDR
jgi:hypothetical protein